MEPTILSILGIIAAAWFANLEYRMRKLDDRQRLTPTRTEIIEDIDVRLETLKVLQLEIKEDIRDLRTHIIALKEIERKINLE